jgi:hypothetical protein
MRSRRIADCPAHGALLPYIRLVKASAVTGGW